MPAGAERIWVLITDSANAQLCSCNEGIAMPVTPPSSLLDSGLDIQDLRAFKAWFKADTQRSLHQNPRVQHLAYVDQVLREAARERAYDGLVIIAAARIAAELENTLSAETRAMLIGMAIRRSTPLPLEQPSEQPLLRH